jgi:hypothetical protein
MKNSGCQVDPAPQRHRQEKEEGGVSGCWAGAAIGPATGFGKAGPD